MLNKKEFDYITETVFKDTGCIKISNRCFICEFPEMYLMFIIAKSRYDNNYYIEYNITVKAIHDNLTIEKIRNKDEFKDIILQPRLICISLNDYSEEKYKKVLEKLVNDHIAHIKIKGLTFLKELEMNNIILERSLKDHLNLL